LRHVVGVAVKALAARPAVAGQLADGAVVAEEDNGAAGELPQRG
jgi:hypothetical protein